MWRWEIVDVRGCPPGFVLSPSPLPPNIQLAQRERGGRRRPLDGTSAGEPEYLGDIGGRSGAAALVRAAAPVQTASICETCLCKGCSLCQRERSLGASLPGSVSHESRTSPFTDRSGPETRGSPLSAALRRHLMARADAVALAVVQCAAPWNSWSPQRELWAIQLGECSGLGEVLSARHAWSSPRRVHTHQDCRRCLQDPCRDQSSKDRRNTDSKVSKPDFSETSSLPEKWLSCKATQQPGRSVGKNLADVRRAESSTRQARAAARALLGPLRRQHAWPRHRRHRERPEGSRDGLRNLLLALRLFVLEHQDTLPREQGPTQTGPAD